MVAANEAGAIPLPPPPPSNAGVAIPLPPPPPPSSASAGAGKSKQELRSAPKTDAVAIGESKRSDRVEVDGQSVPSVIASDFSDPSKSKKPFTYFEGGRAPDLSDGRPSAVRQSHTTTTSFGIPKVLPLFPNAEEESTTMPVSHLQYNSPLPLYSKESAQESFQQQVGAGAPVALGSSKTFDPARSKTLQLLKEQEEEARLRPSTPHSAMYDEPSKDDVHPHYQGYVNPYQQSPLFKRLQYATNGTDDSHPQTGVTHHPADPVEATYSSSQQRPYSATQHVPMVALHDPLVDGERDHPLDPDFSQKIAAAERPNVPAKQEPSWTHAARNKQQRWDRTSYDPIDGRRSEYREPTPDWAKSSPQPQRRVEITRPYSVPPQQQYQPQYYQQSQQQYQQYQQHSQQQYQQPQQQPQQRYEDRQFYYDRQSEQQHQERLKQQEREQLKFRTPSPTRPPPRGYEMGGTDFNPPQVSPGGTYYNSLPAHYPRRAKTPDGQRGYEFGGTDFGYGGRRHQYYGGGNYHGYGPESPRRRAKSQEPSPRPGQEHWLRTYVAPNVDQIHSRGLVGDTLSNMHIDRATTPSREQRETFGTYFGPTEGFKAGHRRRELHRSATLTEPPTFSISAPKLPGQRSYREAQQAQAYSNAQNVQQSSQSSFSNYQTNQGEYRNTVAAPSPSVGVQQTDVPRKQVNISSLVSGVAEKPGPQPQVIPHWTYSADSKRYAWDTRQVDPVTTRSKDHSGPMPTWAQTAQRKRNDWEMKASTTEARTQLPAAYKVPAQPTPHWARQAEQKHSQWQSEFDRYSSGAPPPAQANNSQNQSSAFQSSSSANRASQFSSSASYQSRQQRETTTTRTTSQPAYTPAPISVPVPALSAPSAAINQQYSSSRTYSSSTSGAPYAAPQPVSRPVASTYSSSYGQNSQNRSASSWQENKPWATGGANTKAHTTGSYVDPSGHQISYKKEMVTSSDPGKEYSMLTEEERKVMEEPVRPGVISRHVTTKYYKKSTFTDSKTTTTTAPNPPHPSFDRRADALPKPGPVHAGVTQF